MKKLFKFGAVLVVNVILITETLTGYASDSSNMEHILSDMECVSSIEHQVKVDNKQEIKITNLVNIEQQDFNVYMMQSNEGSFVISSEVTIDYSTEYIDIKTELLDESTLIIFKVLTRTAKTILVPVKINKEVVTIVIPKFKDIERSIENLPERTEDSVKVYSSFETRFNAKKLSDDLFLQISAEYDYMEFECDEDILWYSETDNLAIQHTSYGIRVTIVENENKENYMIYGLRNDGVLIQKELIIISNGRCIRMIHPTVVGAYYKTGIYVIEDNIISLSFPEILENKSAFYDKEVFTGEWQNNTLFIKLKDSIETNKIYDVTIQFEGIERLDIQLVLMNEYDKSVEYGILGLPAETESGIIYAQVFTENVCTDSTSYDIKYFPADTVRIDFDSNTEILTLERIKDSFETIELSIDLSVNSGDYKNYKVLLLPNMVLSSKPFIDVEFLNYEYYSYSEYVDVKVTCLANIRDFYIVNKENPDMSLYIDMSTHREVYLKLPIIITGNSCFVNYDIYYEGKSIKSICVYLKDRMISDEYYVLQHTQPKRCSEIILQYMYAFIYDKNKRYFIYTPT